MTYSRVVRLPSMASAVTGLSSKGAKRGDVRLRVRHHGQEQPGRERERRDDGAFHGGSRLSTRLSTSTSSFGPREGPFAGAPAFARIDCPVVSHQARAAACVQARARPPFLELLQQRARVGGPVLRPLGQAREDERFQDGIDGPAEPLA